MQLRLVFLDDARGCVPVAVEPVEAAGHERQFQDAELLPLSVWLALALPVHRAETLEPDTAVGRAGGQEAMPIEAMPEALERALEQDREPEDIEDIEGAAMAAEADEAEEPFREG
jgi:hypothetical protein